jgi:hypothetical protein
MYIFVNVKAYTGTQRAGNSLAGMVTQAGLGSYKLDVPALCHPDTAASCLGAKQSLKLLGTVPARVESCTLWVEMT